MVYIVGVDHLVQYAGPLPEFIRGRFKEYVRRCVRSMGIRGIAEEFSEESLHRVYGSSEGTLASVASELMVEHRYCDPEESDLLRLGIPYFYDIRERVKGLLGAESLYFTDGTVKRDVDREASRVASRFWRLREDFWYRRIQDLLDMQLLFVCGHEHVIRFRSLLWEKGTDAEVLDRFWERELFGDYDRLFNMKDNSR